jgi:tetratricopeptide (TPR) repeat protein
MWEAVSSFLISIGTSEPILSGIVALMALAGAVFFPVRLALKHWRPPAPPLVTLANPSDFRPAATTPPPPNTIQMDLEAFTALQAKLRDEARADLAKAHGSERQRLEERIDELTRRYADPETAFAQFQATITDLEDKLTRRSNDIGGDRTNEAKAALERGDFTLAKSLFEEITARAQPEVMASAEASFALGQIAESEIRWHDAASFYAQAAQLNPTYRSLSKAHEFVHHSGNYVEAERLGVLLIEAARREGIPENLAMALNDHSVTLRAQGRYVEAEGLCRQALEIDTEAIGTAHPDYATHLNNLAVAVQAQGRYPEAETLFRQALEIDAKTIGTAHPNYAIYLNNLAGAVQVQARYPEAETLYRQALEIGAKTIGTAHPDYATRLNNLAGTVRALGRYPEAETLFRQALQIDAKTIGTAHPGYATDLNNLAGAVRVQGRNPEAETLYRQALAIWRDKLGDAHPNTRSCARDFLTLLETHNPTAPDIPALRALLQA